MARHGNVSGPAGALRLPTDEAGVREFCGKLARYRSRRPPRGGSGSDQHRSHEFKGLRPFASLHREGIREDELRAWEGLVQRGKDLESAGSYAEALKLYLSAAN